MKEEKFNTFLALACFVGAIGIIYPLNPLVFWDQCVYILHAKYFAGFDIGYSELGFRPPLISLLTAPIAYFQGGILFYKISSILWALLFPVASYYLMKKYLSNKREYVLYIALVLLNGLLQYEAKFFLTDIPSLVLLLFSFYFLQQESKTSPFISGVLCGLGILMRLGNISLLPIFFIALIFKKDIKVMIKFGLSFALTLLPYQLWVYEHHGSLLYNFKQARIEGMRNASFSISKFSQLFNIFGFFALASSVVGLFLSRNYKLILVILFSIIIIPYNRENSRFLLVLVPLIYFSVMLLFQRLSFKWKRIFSFILILEVLVINFSWRQELAFIKPGMKSYAQALSEHIMEKYDDIPYIASSFVYPDLAFFTGKNLIPLAKTSAKPDDFRYIDKAALKDRRVLILVNNKTIPTLKYFENNMHFKPRGTYRDIHFFEYLGHLKQGYRQYRAIRQMNHSYWGFYGKGFLELDNHNKVSQLLYRYSVSEHFIKRFDLDKCNLTNEIRIEAIDTVKIISNLENTLTVDITPKSLGECSNTMDIKFRIRYGPITDFD